MFTISDKPGRYILSLGDAIENHNIPCLNWYNSQDDDYVTMTTMSSEPCPCTMAQASIDPKFKVNSTNGCAIARFYKGNSSQKCCYSRYVLLALHCILK